ncbi:MAG: hypothetical protein HY830_09115 [Actinobacteria bacterium]|nr:hypothetical protein [Actinomycetota bacterium]
MAGLRRSVLPARSGGPEAARPPQYQAPQYAAPQHPAQNPPAQYQPAQYQPHAAGPVPPSSGMSGCAKVALVAGGVLLVLGVVVVVAVVLGVRWLGNQASDFVEPGSCEITSDAVVSEALGTPITLEKGTGLGGLVSGIIDDRVLSDAPSCWGSASGEDSGALLVRVAVVRGGDAAARFQAEVKQAKGVVVSSTDDGEGTSTTVETSPYYGTAVEGIGDEAFCTSLGLTGTVGILVRSGDDLVYASAGGTPDGTATDLLDETAGCERARKLASAVLAG